MGNYIPDEEDLLLLKQPFKNLFVKINLANIYETTNDGDIVFANSIKLRERIDGIVTDGNYSVDASSDVRRTLSLSLVVENDEYNIGYDKKFWINKYIIVNVGIFSILSDDIKWYPLGIYVLSNATNSFSSTSNSLELSLVDLVSLLNGDIQGQIAGMETMKIPYSTKENKISIKQAIIDTLLNFTGIRNMQIGNVGEEISPTDENPNPTLLPVEQEFKTSDTVYDVIKAFRDIYVEGHWETFFDVYGNFICQRIPTCNNDLILLDESVFRDIVISEDDSYDFQVVKNVIEVFGKTLETDRYSQTSPIVKIGTVNDVQAVLITLDIPMYAIDNTGKFEDDYVSGELVGFTLPNISDEIRQYSDYPIYIRIKSTNNEKEVKYLPYRKLIDDYTSKNNIIMKDLLNNTGYCFRIKEGIAEFIFYGEFQVHAVSFLVDKIPSAKIKKKHIEKFGTNNIKYITTDNDNWSFSVEKCGYLQQKLSDQDYSNIYSSSLALQRAEYENWKSSRLVDAITITCAFLPFIDVNQKIKYTSIRTGNTDVYITNKVSYSFKDFKTTIEMRKFYPEYPDITSD